VFPLNRHLTRPGEKAISANGHAVYIGSGADGFGGSWDGGDAFYTLIVIGSASDAASRKLILAVADSTLEGGPISGQND